MSDYSQVVEPDSTQSPENGVPTVDDRVVGGSASDDRETLTTTFESASDNQVEKALRQDMARYPTKSPDEIAKMHNVPEAFAEYVAAVRGTAQLSITDLRHQILCTALLNPDWSQKRVAEETDSHQTSVSQSLSLLEDKYGITPPS
ncbi:hypothetical protein EXE48_11725 [Halorubrum sp. ASP1]|uniref:hypothetical protein n=1 Tax=Halorubrum sp. ASP1 TaxID=2518114 RepID=UPI0010F86ED2|nr:hypothetical protein [Halorubrum sp. ASP1]TKX60634.1 hypothetical protein EXE48_11725 [Halorubrum sp. ASP1]